MQVPWSCGSARTNETRNEPATNSRRLRAARIAHPATANHAHDAVVHPASHPNAHAGRTCVVKKKKKKKLNT